MLMAVLSRLPRVSGQFEGVDPSILAQLGRECVYRPYLERQAQDASV